MLSNITGTWMTAAEAIDPARWAQHIRATVRFADEIQVLLGDPHRLLVEVGPGLSLTESAVRLPTWSDTHRAVRLMRHPLQRRDDRHAFLLALGQLWSAGIDVDWTALHGEQARRVIPARLSLCAPTALDRADRLPAGGDVGWAQRRRSRQGGRRRSTHSDTGDAAANLGSSAWAWSRSSRATTFSTSAATH